MTAQAKRQSRLMLIVLPLTVFAFSAPAINYLNVIFTTNTRWLALALLMLTIAMRSEAFAIFQTATGLTALAYGGWCVSTMLWSQVPTLSLLKASSLLFLMVAMFAAGLMWIRTVPLKDSIFFSLPMVGLALFASLAGQASLTAQLELGNGIYLYQGLASNPNMFGSILAMSMPLLLWGTYRTWSQGKFISAWSISLAVIILFLIMSRSRASLLVAIVIFTSFVLVLRPQHRIWICVTGLLSAVLLTVVAPNLHEKAAVYVRKGGNTVLFSREQVWAESYRKAVAGGIIGAGYGVTVGDHQFELGLTSFGYGREKGNSQLAIAEETGLVGLGLYVVFVLSAFTAFVRTIRAVRDFDTRMMLGIMTGAWSGMILNSAFEAWWVAPGSPEAVWFWSLTGVLMACSLALRPRAPAPFHVNAASRVAGRAA